MKHTKIYCLAIYLMCTLTAFANYGKNQAVADHLFELIKAGNSQTLLNRHILPNGIQKADSIKISQIIATYSYKIKRYGYKSLGRVSGERTINSKTEYGIYSYEIKRDSEFVDSFQSMKIELKVNDDSTDTHLYGLYIYPVSCGNTWEDKEKNINKDIFLNDFPENERSQKQKKALEKKGTNLISEWKENNTKKFFNQFASPLTEQQKKAIMAGALYYIKACTDKKYREKASMKAYYSRAYSDKLSIWGNLHKNNADEIDSLPQKYSFKLEFESLPDHEEEIFTRASFTLKLNLDYKITSFSWKYLDDSFRWHYSTPEERKKSEKEIAQMATYFEKENKEKKTDFRIINLLLNKKLDVLNRLYCNNKISQEKQTELLTFLKEPFFPLNPITDFKKTDRSLYSYMPVNRYHASKLDLSVSTNIIAAKSSEVELMHQHISNSDSLLNQFKMSITEVFSVQSSKKSDEAPINSKYELLDDSEITPEWKQKQSLANEFMECLAHNNNKKALSYLTDLTPKDKSFLIKLFDKLSSNIKKYGYKEIKGYTDMKQYLYSHTKESKPYKVLVKASNSEILAFCFEYEVKTGDSFRIIELMFSPQAKYTKCSTTNITIMNLFKCNLQDKN